MVELSSNGTHILATWTEPMFPNGNLSYRFSITCTSLLEVDITVFIEQDLVTMETAVAIEFSVSFYSRYEITVTPFTGAGPGNPATDSFDTDQGGTYIVGTSGLHKPIETMQTSSLT